MILTQHPSHHHVLLALSGKLLACIRRAPACCRAVQGRCVLGPAGFSPTISLFCWGRCGLVGSALTAASCLRCACVQPGARAVLCHPSQDSACDWAWARGRMMWSTPHLSLFWVLRAGAAHLRSALQACMHQASGPEARGMFDGDDSSSVCARVLAMANNGCSHIHRAWHTHGVFQIQELYGPSMCPDACCLYLQACHGPSVVVGAHSTHTYTHPRRQPLGPGTSTAKLLQSTLPITMLVRVCGPRTHMVGPGSVHETGPLLGVSGLGPIHSGASLGDVRAWLPPVSALVLQH